MVWLWQVACHIYLLTLPRQAYLRELERRQSMEGWGSYSKSNVTRPDHDCTNCDRGDMGHTDAGTDARASRLARLPAPGGERQD